MFVLGNSATVSAIVSWFLQQYVFPQTTNQCQRMLRKSRWSTWFIQKKIFSWKSLLDMFNLELPVLREFCVGRFSVPRYDHHHLCRSLPKCIWVGFNDRERRWNSSTWRVCEYEKRVLKSVEVSSWGNRYSLIQIPHLFIATCSEADLGERHPHKPKDPPLVLLYDIHFRPTNPKFFSEGVFGAKIF